MSSLIYNGAKASMNADNWASFDVRAALVGPVYTPDPSHVYVNQFCGELTAPSYTRKVITGRFGAVDTTNGLTSFAADNPTWLSLAGGELIKYLIFYKHVTTDDADSLLLYCLMLSQVRATGDNLVVRFNGGMTAGVVFALKETAVEREE